MTTSQTTPLNDPVIEDPSVYLDDPNRKQLELDTDTRQGPVLFRWLTLGMEYLIGAILVALIVAVSCNVIGRAVFNHSLPWADELARMLFIWLVFVGAAAAFARYEHIAVDALVRRLPMRFAHVLYFIQHLIITGLMGVMLVGGFHVMASSTGRSAILGVPSSLVSLSLVLCVLFIAVVSIWRMWVSLRIIRQPGQGD
ncbi:MULTISPECIES: TRAP transporter small permease [unclassified Halomonas]|uniref:TRAP transporter small permease n=1 Tax=unclassified Halomonas TaxID=2609666 RepID=UPI0006DB4DA8|nr:MULTISPECIES: TRAP transporter small permease [unclassified Halomonas]KPQ26723.1 MAG: TRAP-type gluconate uptake system small permease component GntY [Halomonas sp. HL-93]SBR47331.1 TRAP-type C4-dicarboxylate transport system, small permease component [Halomonas sp. HL-93]SNY99161.1 TRAP-type C4-dicarboxylate transport system, small permease component [Halomonas sp. hl-4]